MQLYVMTEEFPARYAVCEYLVGVFPGLSDPTNIIYQSMKTIVPQVCSADGILLSRLATNRSAAICLPTLALSALLVVSQQAYAQDVTVLPGESLDPGESNTPPIVHTINGNLTMEPNSSIIFDIDPVTGVNDLVVVNGDFTIKFEYSPEDDQIPSYVALNNVPTLYGVNRILTYSGSLLGNGDGSTPFMAIDAATQDATAYEVQLQLSVEGKINLLHGVFALSPASWDGGNPNGEFADGGSGVWQTGMDNWVPTFVNPPYQSPYNNGYFAIFDAVGGNVDVQGEEGVGAAGLQFAVDGYNISGGKITLAETTGYNGLSMIRVGDSTQDGVAYTATIDSEIAGMVGIAKEDLGTLVLNGINTYSGDTYVNGGKLVVNGQLAASMGVHIADGTELEIFNGAAINDLAAVTGTGDNALFTVNNSETIGSLAGDGLLNFLNDSELTTGGNDADTAYDGVISGDGILTKVGAGTMVLTGVGSDFTTLNNNEGNLQIGTGDPLIPSASSVTVDAYNQIMGATLTLDVMSAGTPLTVTGDLALAGDISILNLGSLTGDFNKVLIDAGGTVNGMFNQAEGAVLYSNGTYNYVLSYLLGDGNDIGLLAVLVPVSVVQEMMQVSQQSALGALDDIEDRIMLHRRIGFYEDRKATTVGTAQNSSFAQGSAGSLKSEGYYGTMGYSEFNLSGDVDGRTNRYKVGYENRVNPDLWLGWQFSYDATQWSRGTSNGDLDAYRLSLYGSWTMKPRLFLDAALSAGLLDHETERQGGISGDGNGMDVQSFARVVWRAIDNEQENGFVRLSPYVGVRGVWTDLGAYDEDGGSTLKVSGQSAILGQLYAGVDWSQWYDVGSGRGWGYHARVQGYVADAHQIDDANDQTTGNLMSASRADHWGVRASLGADYCFGDWTLSADASFTESQHSDAWQTKVGITRWW